MLTIDRGRGRTVRMTVRALYCTGALGLAVGLVSAIPQPASATPPPGTPPVALDAPPTAAACALVVNAHNMGDHLSTALKAAAAHAGMIEIDVALIGTRLLASHDVLEVRDPAVSTLPTVEASWSIARRAGRVLFDLKSNSNIAVDRLIAFVISHPGPAYWFSTPDTRALDRIGRRLSGSVRLLTIRNEGALTGLLAVPTRPTIDGVSIQQRLLTRSVVRALRRRGLLVQPYTVDQMSRINQLAEWGITGVTTNDFGIIDTFSGGALTKPTRLRKSESTFGVCGWAPTISVTPVDARFETRQTDVLLERPPVPLDTPSRVLAEMRFRSRTSSGSAPSPRAVDPT